MGACSSSFCVQDQQQAVESQTKKDVVSSPAADPPDEQQALPQEQEYYDVTSTLFFDARQSFSDIVAEIPYAPTMTMMEGAAHNVTIDDPSTLLKKNHNQVATATSSSTGATTTSTASTAHTENRVGTMSASVGTIQKSLQDDMPGVSIIRKGYPGELTETELAACLELRRRLKQQHDEPAYREIVYCYSPFEEEAFALCRILRARNFVVDDTFEMMKENVDRWKDAQEFHMEREDPHKYIREVMGCPLPVLYSQIPMVDSGVAKNGSYVSYFQPRGIDLEGSINCTKTSCLDYIPYVWFIFIHAFKESMKHIKASHDDTKCTVLAEAIFIVDLKGVSRSLFTSEVMEFLKLVFAVMGCFPEILNRMVIVNVPVWFTMIWAVLKVFVDPRTVKKTGFFSSSAAAKKDLLKVIDPSELLSDYGGAGCSFDEALQQLMIRDGDYDRYVIERLATGGRRGKKHQLPAFELKEGETADITVYTQAQGGAQFRVIKDSAKPLATQLVKNKSGTLEEVAGSNPQMTEVATKIYGPGKLTIEATPVSSSSQENFLVVASIR